MNINMTHIGEREMTNQANKSPARPVAIVLALAAMMTFWVPTLTTPVQAASGAQSVVIIATTGDHTPVLM